MKLLVAQSSPLLQYLVPLRPIYLPQHPGIENPQPAFLRQSARTNFHIHTKKPQAKLFYRGADKSLSRPGRKQARRDVRDASDFNNIETRAVIKLFFLQGKAPKEIHVILTETLACFLPGQAKDLSVPLYVFGQQIGLKKILHRIWEQT